MNAPVYLIDDDEAVRRALALLLSTVDIDVTTFADPKTFLSRLPHLDPGCLIIDIRMPEISGLRLQESLGERAIDWPVIIISGHGDIEACRRAFRNGAIDFLSKPIDEDDLIETIQRAQSKLGALLNVKAQHQETAALLASLTPRERDVLSRVAAGFSTRDIAIALDVSPRTIESHRASLGAKLGTTSQAEMTRLWLEGQALTP